jgi:type IV pilus assembly protein PilY1
VKEIAMKSFRNIRSRCAALALAAGLLLPASAGLADDTALFSAAVPPNVLLVIDNSGSMNEVVWHPAFDPTVIPTCTYWQDTATYHVNSDYSDNPSSGDTTFRPRSSWTIPTTSGCVTSARNIFIDSAVQAEGNSTRWDGRYLNWYYSAAADPYVSQITNTTNGTFSSCLGGGTYTLYRRARVTAAKNILRDVICQVNAQGEVRFGLAQFRRAKTGQSDHIPPGPPFPDGSDANGGYVLVPINDYEDSSGNPNVYTLNGISQSHADHLDDAIESLEGESWTPLGETLFQVYTYFMSRNATDLPVGQNGTTQFPKYTYRPRETGAGGTGGDHSTSGAPTVPDSPVQYACQKNFVIIITDGEPTKDDFDLSTDSTTTYNGFASFSNLIGDYHTGDGENETVIPGSCNCDSTGNGEGALYLDDIAKFMHDNDFRPDLDGDQTLDVYTVGFTTNAFANALLQKTALVGNGQYHFSNNAEQLSEAIITSITDVIEKSQSFTAATVPASRTAEGEQLYVSLFTPKEDTAYWEGHLRSYRLTGSGDILDANGNCAIDDPSGDCFSGAFLPVTSNPPYWDAADEMPDPAARKLYTSVLRGATPTPEPAEFEAQVAPPTTGVTATDLNIVWPLATTAAGSIATNADQYAAEVVANVRGCEFGTGANSVACVERQGQLGDIFHSNPVVVGQPVYYESDPSFKLGFKSLVAGRDRVIYAGSNGGFLHGFHAGDWQSGATPPGYDVGTGEEVFGFMPWPARRNIVNKPLDTGNRDYYFVDGSPSVSDVWLYTDYTVGSKLADGSEWRTVLVGSMRHGGMAYFALDVTHPDATLCNAPAQGDGYPCYLWEFPHEDDDPAHRDWMGDTWGDAILTKVRVSVGSSVMERWVAVVTGGYHATSDPNEHAAYDPTSKQGRSIWILDVKTGVPLAWRKFDTAGDCSDPSAIVNTTAERQMCYAMTATPAVYDTDGDGYADVIYAGDLGGNMWKWVIKAPLALSDATTASDQDNDWPFRKFFSATPYDDGSNLYYKSFYFPPAGTRKNGKIWLAFGSGERNDLLYMSDPGTTGDNNRFYVVEETDLYDLASTTPAVVTDADLTDLTTNNTCADLGSTRGYFITGEEGEKWVTNVEIFVGYVIAISYVAEDASTDPCEISGQSFLWAFRVECGQGLFTDASGGAVRDLDIGAGLPTDPRVTVGANGESSNRVIISKQGGDIINLEAPKGKTASGAFYWRELTQ